jgi:hypothetical protein
MARLNYANGSISSSIANFFTLALEAVAGLWKYVADKVIL